MRNPFKRLKQLESQYDTLLEVVIAMARIQQIKSDKLLNETMNENANKDYLHSAGKE